MHAATDSEWHADVLHMQGFQLIFHGQSQSTCRHVVASKKRWLRCAGAVPYLPQAPPVLVQVLQSIVGNDATICDHMQAHVISQAPAWACDANNTAFNIVHVIDQVIKINTHRYEHVDNVNLTHSDATTT